MEELFKEFKFNESTNYDIKELNGMDWLDEKKHLLLLQEKLNSYILYIDTKQYQEYLSRLGEDVSNLKTIEIKISFLFKEPDICTKLIDRAKNI